MIIGSFDLISQPLRAASFSPGEALTQKYGAGCSELRLPLCREAYAPLLLRMEFVRAGHAPSHKIKGVFCPSSGPWGGYFFCTGFDWVPG